MKFSRVMYLIGGIISILLSCLYIYLYIKCIWNPLSGELMFTPFKNLKDGAVGFFADFMGLARITFFVSFLIIQLSNIVLSILVMFVRNKGINALGIFFGFISLTFVGSLMNLTMYKSFDDNTLINQTYVNRYRKAFLIIKLIALLIAGLSVIYAISLFIILNYYNSSFSLTESGSKEANAFALVLISLVLVLILFTRIIHFIFALFSTIFDKPALRVFAIVFGILTLNYVGVVVTVYYWPYYGDMDEYSAPVEATN